MRTPMQVLTVALAAAAAAACGGGSGSSAPAADEGGGAYQQAESELSRATREMYVHIALLENLGSDALKIDSTVTGATAVLDGTVPSEEKRQEAESAALGVTGIDRVDDRLTVAAADDSPGEDLGRDLSEATLEARVRLRLLQAVGHDALGIGVTVDGNAVTLDGNVPSAEVREEAGRAARETPGVESVDDRLTTP